MRPFERRALTPGEVKLGRVVFGDEIDWRRVWALQAPNLGFGAMVPRGRTIVFAKWRAHRDFANATPHEQGWFVHELMHVWQARRGKVLALSKLHALGARAYVYKPRPDATLADYNIEAQAEIARHLYLARSGMRPADAPDRAWLEQVWASRLHPRRHRRA